MTHVTCRLTAKNRISGTLRSVLEYGLPLLVIQMHAFGMPGVCFHCQLVGKNLFLVTVISLRFLVS